MAKITKAELLKLVNTLADYLETANEIILEEVFCGDDEDGDYTDCKHLIEAARSVRL